jgi:hypothetical protein
MRRALFTTGCMAAVALACLEGDAQAECKDTVFLTSGADLLLASVNPCDATVAQSSNDGERISSLFGDFDMQAEDWLGPPFNPIGSFSDRNNFCD